MLLEQDSESVLSALVIPRHRGNSAFQLNFALIVSGMPSALKTDSPMSKMLSIIDLPVLKMPSNAWCL